MNPVNVPIAIRSAVVDGGERPGGSLDEPVERIRKVRVSGKPHGFRATQHRTEPRMVHRRIAHPEDLRRQAVHRERIEQSSQASLLT